MRAPSTGGSGRYSGDPSWCGSSCPEHVAVHGQPVLRRLSRGWPRRSRRRSSGPARRRRRSRSRRPCAPASAARTRPPSARPRRRRRAAPRRRSPSRSAWCPRSTTASPGKVKCTMISEPSASVRVTLPLIRWSVGRPWRSDGVLHVLAAHARARPACRRSDLQRRARGQDRRRGSASGRPADLAAAARRRPCVDRGHRPGSSAASRRTGRRRCCSGCRSSRRACRAAGGCRPSCTAIRSPIVMASVWSCVTYSVVVLSDRTTAEISARICTRSLASRLDSGSSIRNTCGSRTIERPIATRCRWPPESCLGLRSSSGVSSSMSAAFLIRCVHLVLGHLAQLEPVGDVVGARSCAGTARRTGTPWRCRGPAGRRR